MLKHGVESRIFEVRNVCGDIPIILVGSKFDLDYNQVHGIRLYLSTQCFDYQRYHTTSSVNTILASVVELLED